MHLKSQGAGFEHKIPSNAKHPENIGTNYLKGGIQNKWLYLVSYLGIQAPHYYSGDEPERLKKCSVTLEEFLRRAHER